MHQGLDFDLGAVLTAVEQAGLFVSLASFLRQPVVAGEPKTDSLGWVDQVPADFTPVSGMQNIPCMLAVYSSYKPNIAGVARLPEGYDILALRHLLLDGYFTNIQRSDLVTVDGVVYQVQSGAEWDSQHVMTRLAVRIFSK